MCGKCSSGHLVSCRHKTSGFRVLRWRSTLSILRRTELMFQVAMVRLIARHYRRYRDDLDLGELRCRWKATRAATSRIAAAKVDLAAADLVAACSRAASGWWPSS